MKRRTAFGIVMMTAIIILSLIYASPGTADGRIRLEPPSAEHAAGTDTLGRDLAGRIGYGILVSFSIAAPVSLISLVLGICLSFAFTMVRLPKAPVLMLSDTMKTLPPVLLALFLKSYIGYTAGPEARTPRFPRLRGELRRRCGKCHPARAGIATRAG